MSKIQEDMIKAEEMSEEETDSKVKISPADRKNLSKSTTVL